MDGVRKRRSFAQVAAEAIAADRAAAAAHAERYCGQVDSSVAKRKLTAAEAAMLKRRIRAFAGDLVQGLHADG